MKKGGKTAKIKLELCNVNLDIQKELVDLLYSKFSSVECEAHEDQKGSKVNIKCRALK